MKYAFPHLLLSQDAREQRLALSGTCSFCCCHRAISSSCDLPCSRSTLQFPGSKHATPAEFIFIVFQITPRSRCAVSGSDHLSVKADEATTTADKMSSIQSTFTSVHLSDRQPDCMTWPGVAWLGGSENRMRCPSYSGASESQNTTCRQCPRCSYCN